MAPNFKSTEEQRKIRKVKESDLKLGHVIHRSETVSQVFCHTWLGWCCTFAYDIKVYKGRFEKSFKNDNVTFRGRSKTTWTR